MNTVTDPHLRLGFISAALIFGSLGAWIAHGLLASPALYAMSQAHPFALGFALLGIFAFGIRYGRQILFEEQREELEEYQEEYLNKGWFTQLALSILNVVYLNVVIIFAVVIALYLAVNVHVAVGAVFAALYPVYDIWIVEKGYPVSIAGVLAIILALGLVATQARRGASWEKIHFEELLYRFVGRGPGGALN